ncbi:MAG: response regulator transcription factor [Planctomycetes bacterium]|nr:response regulator transcription factor [Planctomycetota bacterium]
MRVLIAEDDPKIARFVAQGLSAEGHETSLVHSGRRALERVENESFDLLILDLGLPELDGLEVLRQIRARRNEIRVIVVTARGEVDDRVIGLDLGADDYLAKPFSFVELSARIRALFRRTEGGAERVLTLGQLEVDRVERTLSRGEGAKVPLTSRELQLLDYFMKHADEPQSRAMLADRVWGYQFDTGTNLIDVYVNYLRKKLRLVNLEPVKTLRGIGYVFDAAACSPVS